MAKPQRTYPETATNRARKDAADAEGRADVEEAVARHSEELVALLDSSDELDDALATAILMIASADEADVERITSTTANLVDAADGLSTEEAAALAADIGENADDLGDSLATVVRLQREGHVDDLATVATAFTESLSPAEVEELATMLEANGSDLVDALDVVLALQREGELEALVDTAKQLSALELDDAAVRGMNDFLAAVGEAQRDSRPVGVVGMLRQLSSRDVRAGLGYLLALLKAQGRRVRSR